nr:AAA family ATPase [Sphingomonas telluris]
MLRFAISNFRGIEYTSIELDAGAPGKVVTLIGLNESGKTTVLEAISNFLSSDEETQNLLETVYAEVDPLTFIPKERRGLFTDRISIEADVELDESDIEAVRTALWARHNVRLVPGSLESDLNLEQAFDFEDSTLKKRNRFWRLSFKYKKGNSGYIDYNCHVGSDPIWQTAVAVLNKRIPQIVYFPTFLFDMPDRIYLTQTLEDDVKDSYYRRVFSDVLKHINPKYSLDTHILDRVKKIIDEYGIAALSDASKTDHVDSVVRAASNEISRVIMGAWKFILEKEELQLRVELKWGVDEARENSVYVEPHLIERQQYKYVLKERSLGFRWFFSFLLFTQFRASGTSEHGTVFLFDEPASHLHPSAQVELLKSFDKIMGAKDRIIYSTHSHYLINPNWLEKAYIVNNNAIDLDEADFASFYPNSNDIVAIRYKRFVSDNPTRMTYFQPALDALRVKLSPLMLTGPAIVVEGKFDYYPFVYLLRRIAPDSNLHVFSALGAGEMGIVASVLRGLGLSFVVLLDADTKGKSEAKRYRDEYRFQDEQIMTLDEADSSLNGSAFEGIYGQDVHKLIEDSGLDSEAKLKAKGSALFQLLLATQDYTPLLEETFATFEKVLATLQDKLALQ